MVKTPRKRRSKKNERREASVFPVVEDGTQHETLGDISEGDTSYDHITNKAEAMAEAGAISDQYRALVTKANDLHRERLAEANDLHRELLAEAHKVLILGQGFVQWGEHKFGPFDYIGPCIDESTPPPPHKDKRSDPNPEKNLKISVAATFRWAKQKFTAGELTTDHKYSGFPAGHPWDADAAKARAIFVVERTMKKSYSMVKVPESVLDYIEKYHMYYDRVGTDFEIPAV